MFDRRVPEIIQFFVKQCHNAKQRGPMIVVELILVALIAASDTPRFEAAVATKAEPVVGELTSFGPDLSAKLGKEAITAGDVIELRQVGAVRPAPPWERPHVLLVNGDRWPGHVLGIVDDKVRFMAEWGGKQEVTLSLSAIVAIWMASPRPDAELKANDLDLPARMRPVDEVHLTNGDVVRGTIATMEKGTLTVDVSGVMKKVPVERVAAVVLSSDLSRAVKPTGAVAKLVLTNGARLTLSQVALQDGRLVGKSAGDQSVRVLLADVSQLSVVGGKATYLSELTPAKYEHTPYLGITWALSRDRNTAGGWLRLGADSFDRGIGMHSQSVVTYAVPTGATRFESSVGLDAVAGARGQVKVVAKLDGRDAFGPVELSGEQPPKRVVLPLAAGAKELTLIVEFGRGADVQDHVDWGDARFVGAAMSR
jgi:NPCBM/NEW2 domain